MVQCSASTVSGKTEPVQPGRDGLTPVPGEPSPNHLVDQIPIRLYADQPDPNVTLTSIDDETRKDKTVDSGPVTREMVRIPVLQ